MERDTRPSPPGRRRKNEYRTTVALSRNCRSFCSGRIDAASAATQGEGVAPRASKKRRCARADLLSGADRHSRTLGRRLLGPLEQPLQTEEPLLEELVTYVGQRQ